MLTQPVAVYCHKTTSPGAQADRLVGLVVKTSGSGAAVPGSIPVFPVRIFPDRVIPVFFLAFAVYTIKAVLEMNDVVFSSSCLQP